MKKRERPILFSGPMVRAILDGRKTQTRRVVKAPRWSIPDRAGVDFACPYGIPEDQLWVRESAWYPPLGDKFSVQYCADVDEATLRNARRDLPRQGWRFHASIHMPRWASRITLEIEDVQVERVRDITEEDARAEGAPDMGGIEAYSGRHLRAHRDGFHFLWDEINFERGFGWNVNPWVWAITFRRVGA